MLLTAIKSRREDHNNISVVAVPEMCFSSLCLIIHEEAIRTMIVSSSINKQKGSNNFKTFDMSWPSLYPWPVDFPLRLLCGLPLPLEVPATSAQRH